MDPESRPSDSEVDQLWDTMGMVIERSNDETCNPNQTAEQARPTAEPTSKLPIETDLEKVLRRDQLRREKQLRKNRKYKERKEQKLRQTVQTHLAKSSAQNLNHQPQIKSLLTLPFTPSLIESPSRHQRSSNLPDHLKTEIMSRVNSNDSLSKKLENTDHQITQNKNPSELPTSHNRQPVIRNNRDTKYQVAFITNRPGGELTEEESAQVQRHIMDQMLIAMTDSCTEMELQFINSGLVQPKFLIVTAANETSHNWLLLECPAYTKGGFVARQVAVEEAPWPQIISFCFNKQSDIDVRELLASLALQNSYYQYQMDKWEHVSTKGTFGNWELSFRTPGDAFNKIKGSNWKINYELETLSVRRDVNASEELRRRILEQSDLGE